MMSRTMYNTIHRLALDLLVRSGRLRRFATERRQVEVGVRIRAARAMSVTHTLG